MGCDPVASAHMTALIINGKAVAQELRNQLSNEISDWVAAGHSQPGLATVLIGDDPASAVYVEGKQRAGEQVGIRTFDYRLSQGVGQEEAEALLVQLADDREVSGILLQLPTPPQLDSQKLIDLIPPKKDVDGLTTQSVGLLVQGRPGLRPCTPAGVMELLLRHQVQLEGSEAVIVGRSELVGRPLISMLLAENATVTVCHSRTRDLAATCRRADVLIAAVGLPKMIEGDWIKPGAAVIDVGINRTPEGLVGDVNFIDAADHAGLITPVPGGVGPMTIAMLLKNTLSAAIMQV